MVADTVSPAPHLCQVQADHKNRCIILHTFTNNYQATFAKTCYGYHAVTTHTYDLRDLHQYILATGL